MKRRPREHLLLIAISKHLCKLGLNHTFRLFIAIRGRISRIPFYSDSQKLELHITLFFIIYVLNTMDSAFSIIPDHDLKFLRYTHSGRLTYEDIGQAWTQLLSMPEFTTMKYNLLSDYRNASFNMELEEADEIVEFMKNIEPLVRGKKQSLVVEDPYSTAGSILFQQKVYKEVGFIVKTFSTLKAAEEWLTMDQ